MLRFEEALDGWTGKRLTQEEAARLLGVCARTFRRYVDRHEEAGLDGVADRRMSEVSSRQAPTDEVLRLEALYRESHQGWSVAHFHDVYRERHAGGDSAAPSRMIGRFQPASGKRVTLIDRLKSFNRKERFVLLHHALGFADYTFRLSDRFRDELGTCVGLSIPRSAYVAMDYHLDWLQMSIFLAATPESEWPIANDGLVCGNQEDIDLLVAFERDGTHRLILIEAKGDTSWSNRQLCSKVDRLSRVFANADVAVPVFVLMSPASPRRVKCAHWPEWMKQADGTPYWLELPLPDGLVKPVRCDGGGTIGHAGGFVKVVRASPKRLATVTVGSRT